VHSAAATASALCTHNSAQHSNLHSHGTDNSDKIVNGDVADDVATVVSHTLLSISSDILHTLPDLAPAASSTGSSNGASNSSAASASSLAAAAAVAAHETAAVAAVCDSVVQRWSSYCSAVQSAAIERDAAAVASAASTAEVVEALHSVITAMRTQHAR
jgi:hypothetical protein